MPGPRSFAAALACAFLEGPWEMTAMAGRAEEVQGFPGPWLRTLAGGVLHAFPTPEGLSAQRLAAFIEADPGFVAAWRRGPRPAPLRRHFLPHPQLEAPRLPLAGPPIPLATPGELAAWLGLRVGQLLAAAELQDRDRRAPAERRRYRSHWRGRRLIEAPVPWLKVLQRRLLRELLEGLPVHPAAQGFCRGRSTRTHAALHQGQETVARIDLRAFFPSIRRARVRGLFAAMGYPLEVAALLAGLCTTRSPPELLRQGPDEARALYDAPHLPQGAPSSPCLANLLCWRLDQRLASRAARSGHAYSRYADDLTFSGPRRGMAALLDLAGKLIAEEGFTVNPAKTRVMHRSQRQLVTGIVVNQGLSLPRRELERLEATLVNCLRQGPTSQNREGLPDFRAHLQGRVAQARSVHPVKGGRLRALFEEIVW